MTTPNHYATTQWWRKAASRSGEARLSAAVRAQMEYGHDFVFPGIPLNIELDRVAFEYRLAHGHVGAAVFHADGSLTLVEMKDGAEGMARVVSGIGQVTMNALTVSMSRARPHQIRKALLWSSTGDIQKDVLIELWCEQAGVIPMQFGSLDRHMESINRALGALDALDQSEEEVNA